MFLASSACCACASSYCFYLTKPVEVCGQGEHTGSPLRMVERTCTGPTRRGRPACLPLYPRHPPGAIDHGYAGRANTQVRPYGWLNEHARPTRRGRPACLPLYPRHPPGAIDHGYGGRANTRVRPYGILPLLPQ